jgi:flagellar hook assembly protein FlgD
LKNIFGNFTYNDASVDENAENIQSSIKLIENNDAMRIAIYEENGKVYQTIKDYKYENIRLIVNFSNGSVYEYISVPKATYIKMVNAESPARFAKRHIFNAFPYRKVSNQE